MTGGVRVAHVVEALSGGVLGYLERVLPSLVDRRIDVSLICSPEREAPGAAGGLERLRSAGVRVRVLPLAREISPRRDASGFVRLCGLLRREPCDVLHTHGSKAGAIGRAAGRIVGVPLIVHSPHCFAFLRCAERRRAALYAGLERLAGRFGDVLLACSPDELAAARRRRIAPRARTILMVHGLAPSELLSPDAADRLRRRMRRRFAIDPQRPVAVFVGRLVDSKRPGAFVRAAGRCASRDALFLLAGEGPLRPRLAELARRVSPDGRVRLLGHVDDVAGLYAAADVAVFCSTAEGLPYAVLEAMAGGCAVLAVRAPGYSGLIRNGRTGVLVDDVEELATTVDTLLADGPSRRRLGACARRFVARRHRLDRQIDALVGLYRSCREPARRR